MVSSATEVRSIKWNTSVSHAVAFSIPLPWARSMIIFAGAGASGVLFIYHSLRDPLPVLPLRLLSMRSVLAGCLMNFCAYCCFTIAEFFLPVIGQLLSINSDETLQASLILLPLSADAAVGSMGAGVMLLYFNYPRAVSIGGSAPRAWFSYLVSFRPQLYIPT